MERNTWRDDDKPETKIFFAVCSNCFWEDIESYTSQYEVPTSHCPECGLEDIDVDSDYA